MSTEIKKTIRDSLPDLPFKRIADEILGAKYELSLVVCGDKLAQRMNAEYRKKTYKPNVLSFPYSKNDGEIFLNKRKCEREARQFGVSVKQRAALLFVHGCFHLAGHDHGSTMERLERKTLSKFRIS
jgi:probable rRNA maturation factor